RPHDLPARGRAGAPAAPGRGWDRAVIFRVNLGADAKAEPGWLLPLICRRGGVTRREVGAIRVGPRSSTFEIDAGAAADFALAASRPDPRAPHVHIETVHGATAAPRPAVKKGRRPPPDQLDSSSPRSPGAKRSADRSRRP